MTEIHTIVRMVARRRNSADGNPTKALYTDHGVYLTAKDAMVAYEISDYWADQEATLTLDRYGRVVGVALS